MKHALRLVAAAAAGLLTMSMMAGPASATADDTSADWLSRQLTNGLVHNDQYGFDDYALTADTAFALKEIGGHAADLTAIRDAVAANVGRWISYRKAVYGNSVAKAVVLAQVTGADPRDFGGVNLVKQLNELIRDNTPVGRLQDKGPSDYPNVVGQSFAARALARAGSTEAPAAVRFLLRQQCSKGFFRLDFAAMSADKQSCDAGGASLTAPNTDATALALVNLRAMPRAARTKAVREALAQGVAWLKKQQEEDGSFGGGTTTEASNTNSTGLAAWALLEGGACPEASEAATWVQALQVSGDRSDTPLAGEEGAVAYDQAAYDEAAAEGILVATQDQWRRATTQAAPGLEALACTS